MMSLPSGHPQMMRFGSRQSAVSRSIKTKVSQLKLDHLVNYDIKYRMGQEADEDD